MMIKDLEMSEDLTSDELSRVIGGLKWDRNTENKDVIDARGGQATIGWLSVTFDINGKVSSLS